MAAEVEVQRALYGALSGLGLRVYDSAPQSADGGSVAAFPYVEVGAIVMAEYDTTTDTGFDFVARVHVRLGDGLGLLLVLLLLLLILLLLVLDGRLHLGDLTIAGHTLILLRRETSDVTRIADGSFHGVCEYRGLVTKN